MSKVAISSDITGTRYVWSIPLPKCVLISTASYKTSGSARAAANRAVRDYLAKPLSAGEKP